MPEITDALDNLVSKPRTTPEPRGTTEEEMRKLEEWALAPKISFEADPYALMEHSFSSPGTPNLKAQEDLKNLAKGAGVGPFTLAPDTIGMATELFNWATRQASERMYGDQRGAWNVPVLSGDPLRETIGLDPESGWGMVGEALGGWENALAKGGTAAVKMFTAAVHQAPDVVMAGIIGGRAAYNGTNVAHIASMERATQRLEDGENAAKIFAETGWYRGGDGKMKFFLSDQGSTVNRERVWGRLKENGPENQKYTFKLGDILDHPSLYEAYPELKDHQITYYFNKNKDGQWAIRDPKNPTSGASFDPYTEEFFIHNELDSARDDGWNSILHEVQHYVQRKEGFSGGASLGKFQKIAEDYNNFNDMKYMATEVMNGDFTAGMNNQQAYRWFKDFTQRNGLIVEQGLEQQMFDHYRQLGDLWAEGHLGAGDLQSRIADLDRAIESSLNIASDELRLGTEAPEEIYDLIPKMDSTEVFELALRRYRAQGGEAEARLVEFFRDMNKEDVVRAMQEQGAGTPEDLMVKMDEGPMDPKDMRTEDAQFSMAEFEEFVANNGFDQIMDDTNRLIIQRNFDKDPELAFELMRLLEGETLKSSRLRSAAPNIAPYITRAEKMSAEEAVNILKSKHSTGEMREAANYRLTGQAFKTISEERLFNLADDLGMIE